MKAPDLDRNFSPVHPTEVYCYNDLRFDVTKAWIIAAAWTPDQRRSRFEVREVFRNHLDGHMLDTKKAMDADLTVPVLWVTITEPSPRDGKPYTWTHMIDGYSRAYKSLKQKKGLQLPAFVLTPEESAACRIVEQTKRKQR